MLRHEMTGTDAERIYSSMRTASLAVAKENFPKVCSHFEVEIDPRLLTFTPIDDRALAFWEQNWRASYRGNSYDWDWRELRFKYRGQSRFEAAIWYGTDLACMALGRFSHGKTNLKWKFLMGTPDPAHRLKGVTRFAAAEAAIAFATAVGSAQLTLQQIEPEIVHLYEPLGLPKKLNDKFQITIDIDDSYGERSENEPSTEEGFKRLQNYLNLADRLKSKL